MREPSFSDALQVLLLQVADEGRGDVLFGESFSRLANEVGPFMIGEEFPSVYLECPLIGDPFIDITVLYSKLEPGTHVEHPAASGTEAMLDWFAGVCIDHAEACCGYELDVKEPKLPAAAIHFQPRAKTQLVRPFCEAVGESARADLYLDLAERMPEGWPLSFFGMFRGRPGSPLRVCGYMDGDESDACAADSQRLAQVFDEVGFSAYDNAMLAEISAFLAAAPGSVDFQFDVYPDGSLGDTFAIDAQFKIEQPNDVLKNFKDGRASRVMRLFEEAGVADDRWKLVPEAAFARALPMEQADGSLGRYAFTVMPQWAKARWRRCALQPGKVYYYANAGFLAQKDSASGASPSR